MSYINIKYDDNNTTSTTKPDKKENDKPSCMTCRETNAQSYICAICHNCSEWHR